MSQGNKLKVTLSTGKVLIFREPKMKDLRMASSLSSRKGEEKDGLIFQEEFIKSIIIEAYTMERSKDEHSVNLQSKAPLDIQTKGLDVLTMTEYQELTEALFDAGILQAKKKAKYESI